MLRMPSYTTIVWLLIVLAGCGKPEPPIDVGQPSTDPAESPAKPDTAAAENGSLKESQTLKQAMVDVTMELMKEKQPDIGIDAVREQVEKGITQIREDVPGFLMVSIDEETDLQSGAQSENAGKRIAEAEAFLNEVGIQAGGLAASLIAKHKAGDLSPVYTELLAQLIVADKTKAEKSLSK